jgi:plastocyanin
MTKHSERARREFVSVLGFIVLAFVIGISVAAPMMPARAATNHVVYMTVGFTFAPKFITVAPGDTITWHNNASVAHTATSNSTAWPEVILSGGGTSAAITMPTTPGTYPYICSYHYGSFGMWGEIIVSTAVPEFSSSFVVVVGMLLIAFELMLLRRKQ